MAAATLVSAVAAVLTDGSAHVEGLPLRLVILSFIPDVDTFAVYTTCKALRATVERHNALAQCKIKGIVARVVKPPPARYIVTSVALVRWALAEGWQWPKPKRYIVREGGACALAAAAGSFEVLQLAREHGCDWDERTCTNAAGGGHLEVLQWAREHGCPWNAYTRDCANERFGDVLNTRSEG